MKWWFDLVLLLNLKYFQKRWIVERIFAWFESNRRLSKDFKYHTETSQAMIQLEVIKLMFNRIIRNKN
ncbi:MAG: transposase [Bacteroidales bacterium]|nr:transposase [Bacteroidales bacterium]